MTNSPDSTRDIATATPKTQQPTPGSGRMRETVYFVRAQQRSPQGISLAQLLQVTLVVLGCLGLFTSSGCFSLKLWERKDPRLSKVDPPLLHSASAEEILARVNQNAYSEYAPEGLKSYRCDDVRVRMQGIPATMRASMVVEAPRNLRLRVANPLTGGEAVDIGSNEQEFWFWHKDSRPANVLVCAHDQIAAATQVTSLPLPFRPDWLMEVLGVSPITGSDYEVRRTQPKSPIAELVSVQRTPDQQPVRRIVKVNMTYGVVLEHRVESLEGQMIAKATLSRHFRDPSTRLILPRQIAIDWPAADQQLALSLEFVTVDFNPPSESIAMWQVPRMAGFPEFDLGAYAIRQSGGVGATRVSQGGHSSGNPPRAGHATLEDTQESPTSGDTPGSTQETWTADESLESIDRPIRSAAVREAEPVIEESGGEPEENPFSERDIDEHAASEARPFPQN